ncbi:energy transducer TonB [Thiohalomonas denitrificans]|uniref:Protein TonB n=1 Tax=Thiohalomonas denitrificans TaxID=415747 RepID=A0A1G5PMN7_9GAMM|nr:energy transducer TonB [Thiohalomonas denitrificans]SCZ50738.1 protein TonB [Thiohalomonas denitrificans]
MRSGVWRISIALLVSGLVHGLVVATGTPSPRPHLHQTGKLSLLLVSAEGPDEPAAEPLAETSPAPQPAVSGPPEQPAPARPPPRPKPEPEPEPKPKPEPEPRPEPESEPEPVRQAVDNKPAEVAGATVTASPEKAVAAPRDASARGVNPAPQPAPGARHAVQTRLEEELAEHFHYPLLARRRGWEGEVMLALRITSHGQVDSIEIANSSGHKVLDRAALDAMAKVSRIPGTEYWLNGSELHLQLPIIYQLREG